MTGAEMDRICADAVSKSDKIRRLAKAGVSKGDIARYLDIKYQFVYNVIKTTVAGSVAAPATTQALEGAGEPLTIPEAKRRLAQSLGVSPSAIKIIVEG